MPARASKKRKAEGPPPEPEPEPAPAPRRKRALSTYNEFVRDNYSLPEVQQAAVRDRLKIIGRMWQAAKKNLA